MNSAKQDNKAIRASINDLFELNQLLESVYLPVVDPKEFTDYFYKSLSLENKIIGAIGLEIYGNYGLLRSLVVDSSYRNKGIANQLVGQIIETSKELGLQEVYLLTTTADKYFLKKGFEIRQRENCPAEIKGSKEFSSICPVSSVLMSKKIR